MKQFVITKHGDRCLVLRPGTRDGAPALVRRVSDGIDLELYYCDLKRGGQGMVFYGIEDSNKQNARIVKKLREMRRELVWRGFAPTEAKPRIENG